MDGLAGHPSLAESGTVLVTLKHAARRLRRWPAAMLDRACARRRDDLQAGTEKRRSDRTEKHAHRAARTAEQDEPNVMTHIPQPGEKSRLTRNSSYEPGHDRMINAHPAF